MKLSIHHLLVLIVGLAMMGNSAVAQTAIDYEDLAEGLLGDPFVHMGITYSDVNSESGIFPNGETFEPALYDEFLIENAGRFYDDFPEFGSPVNVLTFGFMYMEGDNFSIGALSTITMTLESPATAVSLDLAYYENGPWGGIEYHLDALLDDVVVASDSFTISDLGGRDNPNMATLAVAGTTFNSLHLYATYNNQFSKPRGMIDDLTITYEQPSAIDGTSWGKVKNLFH